MVREVKENFFGEKPAKEDQEEPKEIVLPDGRKAQIGPDKIQCSEVLFNPSIAGYDWSGVH